MRALKTNALITRRDMLCGAGMGFGSWALLDLLARDGAEGRRPTDLYQQLNTPSRSSSRASQHRHFHNEAFGYGMGDEYEGDGDVVLDEDNTARLRLGGSALGKHDAAAASSENVVALARAKNLAEKNRLVSCFYCPPLIKFV